MYFLIMNTVGYFAIYIDKSQAKKPGARRISEKSLLAVIISGGAIGSYISMKKFHHKTKKYKVFYLYVMPLIIIFQVIMTIKFIII